MSKKKKSCIGTPSDYWNLGVNSAMMLNEARAVITYRLLGMGGLWPVAPSENTRMIDEKLPAFIKASNAAAKAAMAGRRPDQIADAALRPIRAKTKANAKRLSRAKRK